MDRLSRLPDRALRLTPKTHPAPIDLPAYESIASTVGLRMPRPMRSETTRPEASGHRVVNARAGTASMLMAYPTNANVQCRCDLSAKYPETARNPKPMSPP